MLFKQSPARSLLDVLRRLMPERRTYSASQTRVLALGLLSFVALASTMLVLHAWLFTPAPSIHYHRQQHIYHHRLSQHHVAAVPVTRPLPAHSKYSFAQHPGAELGALVNFLAALPSNSLPPSVNPHAYIAPDLVLEFEPRSADDAEVDALVADAWARNPIVIFSELHSTAAPASREMKAIFDGMHLQPAPTVFELDQRVDAAVLRPLLQRLTRGAQLPVALIGGRPIALNELRAEDQAGALPDRVSRAGAVINGAKMRRRAYYY